MQEADIQLKRIQDKLQQLLRQYASVQKENAQLKEQLDGSKKQSAELQQHIDSLKQQVDVMKFSSGEMNEAEKKQFEKRISTYVKEIERCIALLSE